MAIVRYADASDLSVPQDALLGIDADPSVRTAAIDEALDRASEYADSFISNRFQLPLTAWGGDLRDAVGAIATYRLMNRMGYQPGGEDTKDIRDRYKDAVSWLTEVVKGRVTPTAILDSSPTGGNNTDATGEGRSDAVVVQSYPAGGAGVPRDGFWDKDDSAFSNVAVGPSRNRGW